MSVTHRSDSALIPGYHHSGDRGLGVLGGSVPAAGANGPGYIYPSLALPADAGKEYMGRVLSHTFPPGVFDYSDESTAFSVTGAPDGTYTALIELFENGVSLGTFTLTATLGAGTVVMSLAYTEPADDVVSASITVTPPRFAVTLTYQEQGDDLVVASITIQRLQVWHYATQADMVARFSLVELIQLTDRDHTASEVDADVLERALADADAEVDARLQARYALPLASVPRLLVNIACDITRYRLMDDRATDQVTRRYDDAIKLLDRIAKGQLSLGLDAAATATPVVDGPAYTAAPRVFSRRLLDDYAGGGR